MKTPPGRWQWKMFCLHAAAAVIILINCQFRVYCDVYTDTAYGVSYLLDPYYCRRRFHPPPIMYISFVYILRRPGFVLRWVVDVRKWISWKKNENAQGRLKARNIYSRPRGDRFFWNWFKFRFLKLLSIRIGSTLTSNKNPVCQRIRTISFRNVHVLGSKFDRIILKRFTEDVTVGLSGNL